jgi:hypothetical protein
MLKNVKDMKIRLTTGTGSLFAQVSTWEQANIAAKAVFKRNKHSDLHYFIEFDEDWFLGYPAVQETHGSIDLEPSDFHKPHQNNIFTWHLKTWWTNLSNANEHYSKIMGISTEDKQFCKYLLTKL